MMTELERDLESLGERLRASTVTVRSADGRGSGSGVAWPGGLIVTNAHVAVSPGVDIEDAAGRIFHGRVERRDVDVDLAGITIDATDLPPVAVRPAATIRTGEVLVAFGHPLGVRNVLSLGIAFGPHRADGDRFVRADVRLEPGNSGGALADATGQVVGINSMVAGGLGLAVPSEAVRRFLGETVPAPRLGVRLAPVELTARRRAFAIVAVEPESAAERSGLLVGDILLTRRSGALGSAASVEIQRGGVPVIIPILRSDGGIAAAA